MGRVQGQTATPRALGYENATTESPNSADSPSNFFEGQSLAALSMHNSTGPTNTPQATTSSDLFEDGAPNGHESSHRRQGLAAQDKRNRNLTRRRRFPGTGGFTDPTPAPPAANNSSGGLSGISAPAARASIDTSSLFSMNNLNARHGGLFRGRIPHEDLNSPPSPHYSWCRRPWASQAPRAQPAPTPAPEQEPEQEPEPVPENQVPGLSSTGVFERPAPRGEPLSLEELRCIRDEWKELEERSALEEEIRVIRAHLKQRGLHDGGNRKREQLIARVNRAGH